MATAGTYASLIGQPSLATVATSGKYTDLTATPAFATVATAGTYATNSKIWYGKGTTTSGQVTFYPTTTGTSSGTALFNTLLNVQANAVISTNSGAACPSTSIDSATITSGGTLTVHPTSDGTATGTPVFSNIFHATATPWVASGGALSATPIITGQSISSDFRTVSFTLVNASELSLSSTTATCTVVVYGAP